MERFLCIHGHFYQPPRENPWLESVEIQDSAYPYHDWNERITAECYAPNTASRNLGMDGRIQGIVCNYARISFNFGPTLLSWMEKHAPDTHGALQAADRQSILWRSGHGSALAQVYNHIIMPLATLKDKRTEVRWGIKDFEYRFRRFPEGMWLAETAVDTETLEVLAEAGIHFTILAPRQAGRVRKIGVGRWKDVTGSRIDPTRPYLCLLPSGRSITIFFYDGPLSQAVAFENLLDNGDTFAARLMSGFSEQSNHSQLVHIATDGESYGHHHHFGEMALGRALSVFETNGLARLTNYGEYLELNPALHEVQIVENSSWSCCHGIERWRNDCGCNSGGHDGWNQQWRQPLRNALDWLGEKLADGYKDAMADHLMEPWGARNEYIEVMLDRSEETVAAFLVKHSLHPRDENGSVAILSLLEMQRHALLMFTSCGWFFDELSGMETVQIIQYAARAMQLAERYASLDLSATFLEKMALAGSNLPQQGNGAQIYERYINPAMIDAIRVGAHFAVSFVFEEYGEETDIFSYRAHKEDSLILHAGQMKVAVGKILVRSSITGKADRISFCNLYFGGQTVNCGACSFVGEEAYLTMKQEVVAAFNGGDYAAVIRLIDTHFGMHNYSIKDLFRDEQRHILKRILADTLQDFENKFITLYENSSSLMGFVRETGMPVPHYFITTAENALNLKLQKMFATETIDVDVVREDAAEIKNWNVTLEPVALEFIIRGRVRKMMTALLDEPEDAQRVAEILTLVEAVLLLPVEINLWQAQNMYWTMLQSRADGVATHGKAEESLCCWSDSIKKLGVVLQYDIPALLATTGKEV